MVIRAALLALCLMFLTMTAFVQSSEVKRKAPAMEDNGGEIMEGVNGTLQAYLQAFEAKDIEEVMAVFADAPNTVLMGTGPDEFWLGKEDIRMAHQAFFADFVKESSERTLVSLGANGDTAWMVGYIVVTHQDAKTTDTFQVNLSMVFEQVEGTWSITAMHFSNLTGSQ